MQNGNEPRVFVLGAKRLEFVIVEEGRPDHFFSVDFPQPCAPIDMSRSLSKVIEVIHQRYGGH